MSDNQQSESKSSVITCVCVLVVCWLSTNDVSLTGVGYTVNHNRFEATNQGCPLELSDSFDSNWMAFAMISIQISMVF